MVSSGNTHSTRDSPPATTAAQKGNPKITLVPKKIIQKSQSKVLINKSRISFSKQQDSSMVADHKQVNKTAIV